MYRFDLNSQIPKKLLMTQKLVQTFKWNSPPSPWSFQFNHRKDTQTLLMKWRVISVIDKLIDCIDLIDENIRILKCIDIEFENFVGFTAVVCVRQEKHFNWVLKTNCTSIWILFNLIEIFMNIYMKNIILNN